MSQSKTILMIAYYFPPAAGVGTFRITKFTKFLKHLGYRPVIVSINPKHYRNTDDSLLNDLNGISRYNVEFINANANPEKDFYYSLLQQIKKIVEEVNPKWAFITGGPFHYLKIGPILLKKYGIKYIIDLRDPWSLQKTIDGNFFHKTKNRIYKRYARYLEKKIFKDASYITTVNDTMTSDYGKVFPKYKEKFITLPNAIDMEDYLKEEPYKFDNYTILYSGKFSTSSGFRNPKNFLIALKNINQTRNSKIKFIHIGEKDKDVENIVNTLKCNDFVEFYGNCSYKKTISYCKGADILLVLSTEEKCEQTGKIYDYLGCNRKILAITNKNNEIYKICEENSIPVANPKDVTDIEKKLEDLIEANPMTFNIENMETRETITKQLINLLKNK